MSTPRTDAAKYLWKSTSIHRDRMMVDPEFSEALETELFLANQKLQAIRELVSQGNYAVSSFQINDILNQ